MVEKLMQHLDRPKRWDAPFDPEMTDQDVDRLLNRPEFSSIDESAFPSAASLRGILRNDCRITNYQPGQIIVREGDYGSSAFLILSGDVRVVLQPGPPQQVLGRSGIKKRGIWNVLRAMWTAPKHAETRDIRLYSASRQGRTLGHDRVEAASLLDYPDPTAIFCDGVNPKEDTSRIPALRPEYPTTLLPEGTLFGEIAALARVKRTATVYSESNSQVLELRWQALRDIQKRDSAWREKIERVYRANLLKTSLPDHPLMAGLDSESLKQVADQTLFETYGSFEWNVEFKMLKTQKAKSMEAEHLVARQGEYPDGLLLVIGGFGRVTQTMGDGERTLTYLREGQWFGLDELYELWKTGESKVNETSLFAVGYLQLLRIPYDLLSDKVFPRLKPPTTRLADAAARPLTSDAFLEWAVDERFINGTQTMLIDTNKCVRCDDCVVACAEAHDGNPRFIRSGVKLDNWMVANACMHCVDPVCLIGCPTGAIHRNTLGGTVVINDLTCIGCGTCANACPYDNIHLVTISDQRGVPILDPQSHQPIQKATKCDMCESIPSGPSCQRACAHGALQRVDLHHLIQAASTMV